MASIHSKLKDLDSWVRNRLRYCIWNDWKKPERKRKNLLRLGIEPNHAYAWSITRMGGWAVAQSPIMITTITLERLRKRGYESMLDHYLTVAPQLNEPLYPAGGGTYSGVRGAPHRLQAVRPSTRLAVVFYLFRSQTLYRICYCCFY